MILDRPLLGIALMLGFCLLAPLSDAVAKLLTGHMPVLQLVAIRFGLQVVILAPLVRLGGRGLSMTPRLLWLTALRTVLHIVGIAMMFSALAILPLADAVAIAFVMPFILLLLGWLLLGEEVGPRRLAACAVGFIGTLMVVQPAFAEVGPGALLPVGVAVVFALFMLITRVMAKDVDAIVLQTSSGIMACLVLVPIVALSQGSGIAALDPVMPQGADWALLAALGGLGTLAHLMMTWSLRFAPASTLAPMQYLEIPVAALIGWLVFRDFPNGLALAGICVTILAGLYIVWRERRLSRTPGLPAPEAAALSAGSPKARR